MMTCVVCESKDAKTYDYKFTTWYPKDEFCEKHYSEEVEIDEIMKHNHEFEDDHSVALTIYNLRKLNAKLRIRKGE